MSSNYSHCNLPSCEYYLKCKKCQSILYYNCLYPAYIISKSCFHSKNPPPAFNIAIFNSSNFSFSCSSCLTLYKFPSTNHTTTPPITMSYSPSIITTKSIHHTSAKVMPHLISDISNSTTTINIQPQHQPNANTPIHIPKLMDLKLSSNHTPNFKFLKVFIHTLYR